MAEVQTSTTSGEMTQRFIEFVMMQAQNAALFLGQIPNPQGGQPEVNLEVAKMFIDQLGMIRVKTQGNLSNDELGVLNNAISNLQMTFYEVSQAPINAGESGLAMENNTATSEETSAAADTPLTSATPASDADAGKKKFSKSYGAS